MPGYEPYGSRESDILLVENINKSINGVFAVNQL